MSVPPSRKTSSASRIALLLSAVVVLGVPDAQVGKYIDGALLCGLPGQQRRQFQRGLDRETDLAVMARFGGAYRMLDRVQRARRENTPHCRAARR